jgi:hypothetical protein
MFGPVEGTLRGHHFHMTTNSNNVSVMYSEVEEGKSAALMYSFLINVGKSVCENDGDFVEKCPRN